MMMTTSLLLFSEAEIVKPYQQKDEGLGIFSQFSEWSWSISCRAVIDIYGFSIVVELTEGRKYRKLVVFYRDHSFCPLNSRALFFS